MSEDGSGDKPVKRTPPPRLASALSNPAANSSQSSVASVTNNLRDTTLGGVQKTKFAPVVNARRTKAELSAEGSGEASSQAPGAEFKRNSGPRPPRGRGRGRGGAFDGPGRGLLSDRRGGAAPAVISGPFSLGPSSSAKSKQTAAPIQVGFAGGVSSRGSGSGQGQGRGFGAGRANSAGYSSVNFADEDEIVDLEKIIEMESLELGEDHCPVHISAPSLTDDLVKSPETLSDIIANNQQLLLIQMPSELPKLEKTRMSIGEEENPEETPQPTDQWPADAEGEYGSLAIHASGRVSLTINGIRYFLESGNSAILEQGHVAGCQSVVAIDPEFEQSFELGQINNSLIASLDISSILGQQ